MQNQNFLESRNKIGEIINNLFLNDTNERSNRYYRKYRNCYRDFDEFRDVVVWTYEKLLTKISQNGDDRYLRIGYIFTVFKYRTIANYKKNKQSGVSHITEFFDYLDFDLLIDTETTIDPASYEAMPCIHEIFKAAKFTEEELAIFMDSKVGKMTYLDIGKKYSISERTVQSRMTKLKLKLKLAISVTTSK